MVIDNSVGFGAGTAAVDLEFLIENICGFGAVYNRCRLGSPFFWGGKGTEKFQTFTCLGTFPCLQT